MDVNKSQNSLWKNILAQPTMWMLLPALIIADILLEIYHRTCFPLYGKPYVKRSEYIHITDRAKLPYLTWYEKVGCAYCGYANGWLHYATVIAGKTESYWCAIAHIEGRGYVPSPHEKSFVKYGDEAAFRRRYAAHDEKYGKDI